jgi:hypothetical protein
MTHPIPTTLLALAILAAIAAPNTRAAQILYTAEGDSFPTATDVLIGDGSQNGTMKDDVTVNNDPAFGANAFTFTAVEAGTPVPSSNYDVIQMLPAGSSLGTSFTLAAMVKTSSTNLMRLFSSWPSAGTDLVGDILFDIDTDNSTTGGGTIGVRLVVNGVQTRVALPGGATGPATDGAYHHYAATYDNGTVNLYFDGSLLITATAGSGSVTLDEILQFGGDLGNPASGTYPSQFVGSADDILIWNTALSQTTIQSLATNGAVATIPTPAAFPAALALVALLAGRRRRR